MDEKSERGNPVRLIEFGPSTLNCLLRLTDAIERTVRAAGVASEEKPLSRPDSIQSSVEKSPYFNAEAAAAYLGTSVSSLYGLVERRQIEPMRGPRRRYRFTKEMLDEYLKGGRRR